MENSFSEIQLKLKPFFSALYKVVIVFGSAATDSLAKESDIDLAVLMSKATLNFGEKSKIISEFQDKLDRTVDLIFLNDADIIITNQILTTGKVIWNSDPDYFLEFQARKTSEYIDFKLSRQIIEQSLDKTGWPKWQKKT